MTALPYGRAVDHSFGAGAPSWKAGTMARQASPNQIGAHPRSVAGAASSCDLSPEMVARAAQSQCTILIAGETGVGKGHLAKWLHSHSQRRDTPFIPVNCGAIPDGIIDSQLFGHAKGAFSGAATEHLGLVRAADTGTLLLDEVGELPMTAQLRLLRLLQEGEVQPVGESRPSHVDVRVIAATNVDLQERVSERKFREDLLYRLDVIRITVLPLRDRLGEIEPLTDRFNTECARAYGHEPLVFGDSAREAMMRFAWPGNVRQLRSVIERLHVFCAGQTIDSEMLVKFGGIGTSRPVDPLGEIDQARQDTARRALAEAGGSMTRAAEQLGVHRSTLYRWLGE